MAFALFSWIQFLFTKLLHAIQGWIILASILFSSTSYPHDPVSVREELSRMLTRIQAVQQDAEERQIHDSSVRLWLAELRGVASQVEDVLDEFHYEVLRSIVESGDAAVEAYHRGGGTRRQFAEMYTSSSIPDSMAKKIKGIKEKFEAISNDRRFLHLREEDGTRLIINPQIRPPTSSHVDDRAIFGREKEKEKIISLLGPSNGPDFMVLPIVGMGGFGKTTLAQLVFNDSRIHGSFNKRCWVSVSENFDLVQLTKAIVESVSNNPCQFSELSKLQDVLKENIRGLSLFLVLDDVWNEKRDLWESFRVGFLGAKVVRILITTRNTSVSKIMQTMSPFKLGSLPVGNCWSLFKHFAFGNREVYENEILHMIGHGIVQKCKGSPLATKVVGGILRYEMDEDKWWEILESDISEIDETGEIMPALRLSYQKLPRHLKPCFLYLSMFPKDTRFEKDMVVRLWMAQGYIDGNTRNLRALEEIGSMYFDELHGRSLVNCGHSTRYFLHDLIHDLARSISQDAYELVLENDQQCNGPRKIYHLYSIFSNLASCHDGSIRTFAYGFVNFDEIDCARALLLRSTSLPNTLCTLKHLRYLSIEDSQITTLSETLCFLYNLQTLHLDCHYLRELPENIKNMINLRYFKLCSHKIQQLPKSIFLLRNLHILLLSYCTKLKELPRGMEQLTKLRILDLPSSLIYMPSGIGKLTTLKPLTGHFSVMDHGMIGGLGELENMNKLSGLLCVSGLRNISDVEHSRNANLASKSNLHKLILNFQGDCSLLNCRDKLHLHLTVSSSKNAKNENDEKMQDVVLESLQPHGNLTELEILNYGGRVVPSWLVNPLLPKLTTLTINFCTEPNFLPPFGQLPHLRFLDISGNASVRNVGDELSTYSLLAEYGSSKQPREPSYPSLEVLSLKNTLNLVEWQAHDGDFPSLKQLTIENCPKLREVAIFPKEVREVTFKHCPKLKLLTCPSVIGNLMIHECGFCEIMFGSILECLVISKCIELISINWMDWGLNSVREVSFKNCPKLELVTIPVGTLALIINECGFREITLHSVSEYLTISNCIELISINWMDGGLNSVREISFECCPKLELVTIPVGTLALIINECGFREITLHSVSEYLTISNCIELISINWMDGGLNYVKEISFECCPKLELVTIPVGTLALIINECGFREITLQSVSEYLKISNCIELISINWMDWGLNSVREVSFKNCPKLELVTIPVGTLALIINECGFREITLHSVSEYLTISNCIELISINWMDGGLNYVKEISFECCPKLELQFFVNDALHSMTQRAEIYNCPGMDLVKRYVYQSDTMIRDLNLSGNNEIHLSDSTIPFLENHFTLFLTKDFRGVESFTCAPLVGVSCQCIMLNLGSLVTLDILRCTRVTSVAGLDNLSNLICLNISYCPELCNWNDNTLPLSLKFLELNYCDKLSSLPLLSVQNHSSALKSLVIMRCPRLVVLEGFHGLMNLKTVKLLHCRNIIMSPATKSLQCRPRIKIGDCPLMRDWCQRNNITYYELNPIDDPQDAREVEQESAGPTTED